MEQYNAVIDDFLERGPLEAHISQRTLNFLWGQQDFINLVSSGRSWV